jgi:hypothetical protein
LRVEVTTAKEDERGGGELYSKFFFQFFSAFPVALEIVTVLVLCADKIQFRVSANDFFKVPVPQCARCNIQVGTDKSQSSVESLM